MVTFSENSTKQDECVSTETNEVDKGKDGESGGSSHDAFSASKTKRVRLSDGVKGKTLCADFFLHGNLVVDQDQSLFRGGIVCNRSRISVTNILYCTLN